MTQQYVWAIDDIDPANTARFGGKGAGLARMVAANIPVPPAFVISTDGFHAYRTAGAISEPIKQEVAAAIQMLERATGRLFGRGAGGALPLLVSVRSGAQVSMPGMMDTVLNLGITAAGAERLAQGAGNPEFALETWQRFWRMFCDVVLDLDGDVVLNRLQPEVKVVSEEHSAASWGALEQALLAAIADEGVSDVQADPHWQLERAIAAVFKSWDNRRARAYRAHHKIDDNLGTAVTVQAMVFGNLDALSGSGVAFTRNPNDGARELYGEFLQGGQGEDLVSGTVTPIAIATPGSMREEHRQQLHSYGTQLEAMYRDAVDIEFTIEGQQLYFLQVRRAKRTARAAAVIAADLVADGIIDSREALNKLSVEQLKSLLRPSFDKAALAAAPVLTEGTPSSPGHAWGVAVLDADRAKERAAAGERVVLLRPNTSPQDIRGMLASDAIVTSTGGALSHAAVVARALDVACVTGCDAIEIEPDMRRFVIDGKIFEEGAQLSVDGATGRIYRGQLPVHEDAGADEHIECLLDWADEASEAQYWVVPADLDETGAVVPGSAVGLGAIALTDILTDSGKVGHFIQAINDLSHNPDDFHAQKRISAAANAACASLLAHARGVQVAIRLPHLGSARAQRLMDTWAALAPRLFLPLGLKSFYQSLLHGVAAAQKTAERTKLIVLAPALSDVHELKAFGQAAQQAGLSIAGGVLQNPASVFAARSMAETACPLWLSIRDVIRNFHGYPHALSLGDEVFEDYAAEGYLGLNPRESLDPVLRSALQDLADGQDKTQVVVDCGTGSGTALALIGELYMLGFRSFSVPSGDLSAVRLSLGQIAARQSASYKNEW